jgi:transposase
LYTGSSGPRARSLDESGVGRISPRSLLPTSDTCEQFSPLSDDLRKARLRRRFSAGCRAIRRRSASKLSIASAVRWVNCSTTGEISPAPFGGDRHSSRIEAQRDYLFALVRRRDITLLEIWERLIAKCDERLSASVLWRFFDRHEITFKFKKSAHAEEQQRGIKSTRGMLRGPTRS